VIGPQSKHKDTLQCSSPPVDQVETRPTVSLMSNNHALRRPQPGEPLRVLVLARDASGKSALAASIAAMGRTALVEDRESHAHVAIIDVSTLPTQTMVLGQPVDAARQRLVRHALDEALAAMAELSIPTLVLVHDESQARAAVSKGARGAVKKSDAQRVKAALDGVAAGLSVVDFALVQNKVEGEPETRLTGREQEVVELLVQGLSNRRIAKRLGISEHTAKFHVNGILLKLGAGTRTEAVVQAARRGLIAL
jgi:two-component system nitrate/nitrite response regulator NarL